MRTSETLGPDHDGQPTGGDRGLHDFALITDTYGRRIRVRTSSSAEGPRVWIFTNDQEGYDGIFHLGEWHSFSPHLNVEQAERLIDALQRFVKRAKE